MRNFAYLVVSAPNGGLYTIQNAEDFLKEFTLYVGQSFNIKGLGTLRVVKVEMKTNYIQGIPETSVYILTNRYWSI